MPGTVYKHDSMNDIDSPLVLFKKWFEEELAQTNVQIPTAVCLSTIGHDDFPNARFVSFKELVDGSFIITGPLNSRKGTEVSQHNKVSLTFWWTATERQVRVQGIASFIDDALAEKYFAERGLKSKAVSSICEQGKEVTDLAQLERQIQNKIDENPSIDKPKYWSGFSIKPIRIELMEFKKTRFHDRKLFELVNDRWTMKQIQP